MVGAIEAEHVGKTYRAGGAEVGLRELSVDAVPGTVLALLGPNGAGKTTAVRGLSTLLNFDRGRARVAGYDVRTEPRRVRERIALVGQSAAADDQLTAAQNLVLFGRLRGMRRRDAECRAGQLLGEFGLADAGARAVRGFSGGMRRRLDVAAAMLVRPEVLFVDEPTTGLDPVARRDLWRTLRALVREGTTVLLTTQYLEEADALADHIVLLDRGVVVAQGSSDQLKSMIGPSVIHLRFGNEAEAGRARSVLQGIGQDVALQDMTTVTLSATHADALTQSIQALQAVVSTPLEVTMRKPSLDEVFVSLTGQDTYTTEEEQ